MRQISNATSDAAELVASDDTYWDANFRDAKGRIVEPVSVHGAPVADTHCHLDMLPHPELAIARAAVHGVRFIVTVVDPTEEPEYTYNELDQWLSDAKGLLKQWQMPASCMLPECRVIIGCHPHNASKFVDATQATISKWLTDSRSVAVGEIGLDYHYDASPRDVQREAFRLQLQLAHQTTAPVSLHLRDAHDDGYQILEQEGWPAAGVLLHCYTLGYETLQPFLDKGAQVAFGGTMTFNNAEELRRTVRLTPSERILTETDAPFMTPAPLRGTLCGPEHTLYTAAYLAAVKGASEAEETVELLKQIYQNGVSFFGLNANGEME